MNIGSTSIRRVTSVKPCGLREQGSLSVSRRPEDDRSDEISKEADSAPRWSHTRKLNVIGLR